MEVCVRVDIFSSCISLESMCHVTIRTKRGEQRIDISYMHFILL
jgi:hypothetical protein